MIALSVLTVPVPGCPVWHGPSNIFYPGYERTMDIHKDTGRFSAQFLALHEIPPAVVSVAAAWAGSFYGTHYFKAPLLLSNSQSPSQHEQNQDFFYFVHHFTLLNTWVSYAILWQIKIFSCNFPWLILVFTSMKTAYHEETSSQSPPLWNAHEHFRHHQLQCRFLWNSTVSWGKGLLPCY